MSPPIYASDPDAAGDEEFVVAELRHVVVGTRGRLRDARRTPVSIVGLDPGRGEFEIRIEAFEDRGARWRLPLWEVDRVQVAAGSPHAPGDVVAVLRHAVELFDRPLIIDADAAAAENTRRRVARHRGAVRELLSVAAGTVDLAGCIARRAGDPRLYEVLARFLDGLDLAPQDHAFCQAMVGNPRAGELVKGHAVVLAEIGLCPFAGTVVRDPELFADQWSRARRAEHIIARLAFVQELWATCVRAPLILYRAAATDGPPPARGPTSLVSCTFAHEVAAAHFSGGPATTHSVMWRQVVATDRLLMTFLETREMNQQFKEAEAVLIGDSSNAAF